MADETEPKALKSSEPSMNRHKPASNTTQVRERLLNTATGGYSNSLTTLVTKCVCLSNVCLSNVCLTGKIVSSFTHPHVVSNYITVFR